ncbi:MAG: hypothetical protein V1754_03595 [Pseudomonadota bacterium]
MLRVGVKFEDVTPADQAVLDRYVFDCMRRDARQKRHVRGQLYGILPTGGDRRRDWRVDLETGEIYAFFDEESERQLSLADQAKAMAEAQVELQKLGDVRLQDLSSSGCAFFYDEGMGLKKGMALQIRLMAKGFRLVVRGRLVYLRREKEQT